MINNETMQMAYNLNSKNIGDVDMATGEELGYQDAIRQVQRSIHRRLKVLEEESKEAEGDHATQLEVRISELNHVLRVVESLHR